MMSKVLTETAPLLCDDGNKNAVGIEPGELRRIAEEQDAKIQGFLATRRRMHFWYASCRDAPLQDLHTLGFDNYPLASVQFPPTLFFFEQLMGCRVQVFNDQPQDFCHTWCEAIVADPGDVRRLERDFFNLPVWRAYEQALLASCAAVRTGERLPVPDLGFCPLDWACNICGTERLFTFLYDAEQEVDLLLDLLCDLFIAVRRRVGALGLVAKNLFGFPGIYCNDLQLAYLPPAMIERFILPRYERVAAACGGMIFALHSADVGVVDAAMRSPSFLGCAFDKRLPLADIRRRIGEKIFVAFNYAVDPGLGLSDGYPIVNSHGREIRQIYEELGRECSLILFIERPQLEQVCLERERLLHGNQAHGSNESS